MISKIAHVTSIGRANKIVTKSKRDIYNKWANKIVTKSKRYLFNVKEWSPISFIIHLNVPCVSAHSSLETALVKIKCPKGLVNTII